MDNLTSKWNIIKWQQGEVSNKQDLIVTESPLTIMVNGEEFATMVCSWTHIEELVVGFLAAEGAILSYADIKKLQVDQDKGYAYVELSGGLKITKELTSKRFIGSCCGKSRQSFYFHSDVRTARTSRSKLQLSIETCIHAMQQMQAESNTFQQTGGVHNAALFQGEQQLVSMTDIGRHNALDKVYGYCLMQRIPLKDKYLCFSGRVSSEILLKVAKIGTGIILSKSAPTDLALRFAEELNITMVGFLRGNSCNIYTHGERISLIE